MTDLISQLPEVRGKLVADAPLAPATWFRVGGPADALFLPADREDLAAFLKATPADIPVTVLGAASNVIVRDGGVPGVVVRLMGKYWGEVEVMNPITLAVRAGALDMRIAKSAAEQSIAGLEFFSGIPGTIGGAIAMNAGCYDREFKDVFVRAWGFDRTGAPVQFEAEDMNFGDPKLGFAYRKSSLPSDVIITEIAVAGEEGERDEIEAKIAEFQARREEAQPIRDKTGGSTFANPDPPGAPDQRKSWKLIDDAGKRGATLGGAQVSEKHCNFLINTGDATASDLEDLGEEVRAAVRENSGVELQWEIKRIGRRAHG
ncbi:MAG: UDP-N-acetylmuramate dehydrogenase [Pseudomonadota bacterium]